MCRDVARRTAPDSGDMASPEQRPADRRADRAGGDRRSCWPCCCTGAHREAQRLRELGERLRPLPTTGDLAERLVAARGEGSAGDIAQGVDRLLERLQDGQHRAQRTRARLPAAARGDARGARSSSATASALANARFAELCGVDVARRRLIGRQLTDLRAPGLRGTRSARSCAGTSRASLPRRASKWNCARSRTGAPAAARVRVLADDVRGQAGAVWSARSR